MTLATYLAVVALAALSILSTLAGVALAFRLQKSVKAVVAGLGFSTGIMLLIALLELIPESASAQGMLKTALGALSGLLLVAALHLVIPHTHLFREDGIFDGRLLKAGYLAALGLVLHDFPEGFAMASAYLSSPNLGVLVALAVALHNIPEEFAMAVPIVLVSRRGLLVKAALVSGLAEPGGALVGLLAADWLPALNPLLLSFAAGAMTFVSIHELVPMARLYGELSAFVAGAGLSIPVYLGLMMLFPH